MTTWADEYITLLDDSEAREDRLSDWERAQFGCCMPPGECCMPGLHFQSECHTAADYEREHGHDGRETPNVRGMRPDTAPPT